MFPQDDSAVVRPVPRDTVAEMPNRFSAMWKVLAALVIFTAVLASDPDSRAAARESALEWLTLVDSKEYSDSWEQAASLFKSKVTREQWTSAIRSARGPLGAIQSRSFLGAVYKTELPGAPDGEYVIIQYRASFAKKAEAVETITPMLDKDGAWRISGYFIR